MPDATLTRKERLKRALRHKPVDHLPTQINYTARMGANLARHFHIPPTALPGFLDNHLVRVDLSYFERPSADGLTRFDWWGAGYATGEEGYYISHSPLAETKDLDSFAWPDPYRPGLMAGARRTIEELGGDFFVAPNLGFALFERAWSLRGLEQFLIDLALDLVFVEELLERITQIQLIVIERFLELGVDGGYFGDDYGAQKGLLFSPDIWRRLFKPRLGRLFEPFLQRGLPVILHSDGQIQQIIPDLIEIGLTALNPVQPEVLDHAWLAETYGSRLAFYGGISTQTVLPSGTPEQVRQAVAACRSQLAPHDTGLLLAPSHRMMTDIPLDNVTAMLEFISLTGSAPRRGLMTIAERKQLVNDKFCELFGAPPQLWSRAPGRVDLMGSHTDYNLGYVMTMSIDRDTWIAARPRQDRHVKIHSLNAAGWGDFDLDTIEHTRCRNWTDYIRGTAWALGQAGYQLSGFDGLVHSTVPFGSGLSSSAALEMACAVMFQAASGFKLEPVEMALIGQAGENQYVGMSCGILDQYSSALGQAGSVLLLDCRSLESQITPLAPGIQVVIGDTRAERNLAGTEYGERRSQCEQGVQILRKHYPDIAALRDVSLEQLESHMAEFPPVVYKRCRFIIEENQRVLSLAEAINLGDLDQLAALFRKSYQGARDLYQIGAPAMQAMIEAMRAAPGVIAARQAGAGFGGCMVALVHQNEVAAFVEQVTNDYAQSFGVQPQVYPVSPAPGAGLLG